MLVKVIKTRGTISVVFHIVDVVKEVIGKVIVEGRFFSGFVEVDNVVELALSVRNKVGGRANVLLSFIKRENAGLNEFAQIGFFLNSDGKSFSSGSGEFVINERKQITMRNFW